MRGTKAWKQFWKQRGGVFVLTALALPFFLACVGLAIDVGNLYIHKSRLQNAADAAALAGGREFANEGETVAAHPHADTEARSYTNLDMATLGGGTLTDERYKAQQVDDDTILYGVRLTETVPLYFMRIFGMEDTPVVADAAVAIGLVGSSGGEGHDLFIFRHKLKIVNSIDSPDNFNLPGKIRVTFDGNIAFTDGSGNNKDNANNYHYDDLEYSTQTRKLEYFFTEKARQEGISVQKAIDDYKNNNKSTEYAHPRIFENYDMEELGSLTRTRLNLPDEVSPVTDWSDWRKAQAQQNAYEQYLSNFSTEKRYYSKDFSNDVAIHANKYEGNNGSADIFIDSAISGDINTPVYVYLDPSLSTINVQITASNERPVILCYTGTGRLHINGSNGATFRGIIYAPNVPDYDYCLINNNGFTYEGTIIANYLDIQGGQGTYRYKNFGVNGGNGGSGGTKTVSGSSTVRLAPTDGMDWT